MLENVVVQIVKMEESSGNIQFFCRLVRTDLKGLCAILEYQCFQTKHFNKKECLSRAWFSASFLARWIECQMEDVKLIRFDPDEEEYIKTCMSIIK